MMADEFCSGYESHTTAAAANGACSPTTLLVISPISIGSTSSTSNSPAPAMIRRTQSLPTSTTTAETLLASTKSADRGEERCVVVVSHAKSEEQYVDRYGFITEHQDGQQHERGEGDNNNNGSDKKNKVKKTTTKSNPQKLAQQEANREARRVQKWTVMLDSWPAMSVHRRRLIRRRLRKGLPDATTRQRVWPILLRLPGTEQEHAAVTNGHGQNHHHHHDDDDTHIHMSYGSLWRNNDNLQVQDIIERDIHRTFPKHTMFTSRNNSCTDDAADTTPGQQQQSAASLDDEHDGQASLRRVLRAYSAYDTEIGYCQGMNFIAAMFLTILPEEQAFWMLVGTMYEQPCCMRGLFAEGMRATHKVLYVADKLIRQFLPRLAKHLDHETIHVTMYATQWLLTVYTSSFPFELVTRVWDCFLFEGWKIVYRVMLALLQRGDLLKLRFEEILGRFREMTKFDLTGIIEAACKIPLKTRHIQKYEKEWTTLSSEQQVQQGSP